MFCEIYALMVKNGEMKMGRYRRKDLCDSIDETFIKSQKFIRGQCKCC